MHQNLYPEIILAAAIFLMAMLLFIGMVIAALVSILFEHRAKSQASVRFSAQRSAKLLANKNKD